MTAGDDDCDGGDSVGGDSVQLTFCDGVVAVAATAAAI